MTSSAAANPAPLRIVETPAEPVISVRFAESEQDMTAIHRFLLVIAQPAMRCPVNIIKSLQEIIRVVRDEAALMLIHNDVMVGTMGIVNPTWWYGDGGFLTDRWHFVLPEFDNTPASEALMDEAIEMARLAGLEFIHQGRIRRGKRGVPRMRPRVYDGESVTVENGGI